jgi:hypothetical protein
MQKGSRAREKKKIKMIFKEYISHEPHDSIYIKLILELAASPIGPMSPGGHIPYLYIEY